MDDLEKRFGVPSSIASRPPKRTHGDARLRSIPLRVTLQTNSHACHIERHGMAAYALTAVEDAHPASSRSRS